MIEIKSEEHFNKVLGRNNGNVVAVFTAPAWCGPCQRLEPHLDKAEDSELLDEVFFVKVDMGQTREDTGAHWATERFGIMGVPQIYKFDVDWNPTPVAGRTVVALIKELT